MEVTKEGRKEGRTKVRRNKGMREKEGGSAVGRRTRNRTTETLRSGLISENTSTRLSVLKGHYTPSSL